MGSDNRRTKGIPQLKRIDGAMAGWFRKTVCDPSLWITLSISVLTASLGNEQVLRAVSTTVGSAQVHIGTAFLGIVLAGLAIMVIFLDKKYIALLEGVPPGFEADLWPFKYTAFIAVACSASGMALIMLGSSVTGVFRSLFGLSIWSFLYLLWNMFELVRFIAWHARARAQQIQTDDERKE